jgi:hypothetical protein
VFSHTFLVVWLSLFRDHCQRLGLLDVAERVWSHFVIIKWFGICCGYVAEKVENLYGCFGQWVGHVEFATVRKLFIIGFLDSFGLFNIVVLY